MFVIEGEEEVAGQAKTEEPTRGKVAVAGPAVLYDELYKSHLLFVISLNNYGG
jgi:hypothetical protein